MMNSLRAFTFGIVNMRSFKSSHRPQCNWLMQLFSFQLTLHVNCQNFIRYALNYVKNALESYNIGEFVSNNVTMLLLKVVSQPIHCEKHNWGINCVASGWRHEMLNKTSKFWPCSIKKIGHANFESFYNFLWKWKDV
jgi:hypothetical protein